MATKKCAPKAARAIKVIPKGVVGTVTMEPLDSVAPNGWNPNRMSSLMAKSFREGLRKDGWLACHSLLIWSSDETGVEKNVIIDGEHRWRAAKELGITTGPMVRLSGLPEHEAKALTIKMNQKHGEHDEQSLAELVASIQSMFSGVSLGEELGFTDAEMQNILGESSGFSEESFVAVDAPNVPITPSEDRYPITFFATQTQLEAILPVFRQAGTQDLSTSILLDMVQARVGNAK